MNLTGFLSRRTVAPLLAAGTLSLGALAMAPLGAAAQGTTIASEADSNVLQGHLALLGGNDIHIQPFATAMAQVPPAPNPKSDVEGITCGGGANPACATPVVTNVNALDDTAKAFVPGFGGVTSGGSTDCEPNTVTLPKGFETGALNGANACSNIAHAEVGGPTGIVADGVTVQSLTQSCDSSASKSVGNVNIASLFINGQEIPIPGTNNPPVAPNTEIDLPLPNPPPGSGLPSPPPGVPVLATIILNEQHPDNVAGGGDGQGLTVNAVHVHLNSSLGSLASGDVIIGHTHSLVTCGSTEPNVCSSGASCPGITINKTDSVASANPGQSISYTVGLSNNDKCPVTIVTDTLPLGFTYTSSSGPLGSPTVTTLPAGNQQLQWFNATGFGTGATLTETVNATISSTEPAGTYVNRVNTLSDCGQNEGSDKGIKVPASTPPVTGGTQALANTGSELPSDVAVALPFLVLIGAPIAARRIRSTH